VQLALNDIAPSPATLGTLNGLALTLSSAVRMVSPGAFASLFALGAKSQFLNGHFIWVVLVAIAAFSNVVVQYLPEKAEGKQKPHVESE